MSALQKIPATVITGFLGSGKTTLIRHLLEQAGNKRIALIINEFGDLGVDRGILSACGSSCCHEDDIVELANGCICCTVADEFIPTMQTLLSHDIPPDHIVIETSGLALPKPLVKAFQWPEIRTKLTVDGVIAVIDAHAAAAGRFADDPDAVQAQRKADTSVSHDNPLEEVFTDQLMCADMVLLNKADLLDDAGMNALERDLADRVRPGVRMVPTVHGKIDVATLLGLDKAAEDDLESRPSHHDGLAEHHHDDFDTFTVDLGPVADPEALEARLLTAIAEHDILRAKGFVDVPGKPMRLLVQAVGPRLERYYDRPWRPGEPRRSSLVVIGLKGLNHQAISQRLLGTAPVGDTPEHAAV